MCSNVEDDESIFDRNIEGFNRRVVIRRLDGDFVAADANTVRVEDRSAGADIKLPAMPGTLDDILVLKVAHLERPGCVGAAEDDAEAEWSALVRAATA